jgi:hypothetical protein
MSELPLLPLVMCQVPAGLRRAFEQTGVPCCDRSATPVAGRFVLFDSRVERRASIVEGQIPIDIDDLRQGHGFDPFVALDDEQSYRCGWQIDQLRVREVVARVEKRIVRRQLMDDLRAIIEAAGGIWLQVGAYPYPYRSVFNFRIDHDDYVEQDFDATLEAIEGHEAAVSHYVCAADFVGRRGALSRLNGQHVGSHGFRHHTYRDAADNFWNVQRGIEALRNEGIEPLGFTAPHGRFNRGLLAALSQLGVTHSSEFALSYDELPFFIADVLQIPIHPICLGICLEAVKVDAGNVAVPVGSDEIELDARRPCLPLTEDLAAEIALSHFRSVASEAHRAGEPILLYGHPSGRLGRFPHVLAGILETARRLDRVWRTTLSEWEAWWRARAGVTLSVVREGNRATVRVNTSSGPYPLSLEVWRGNSVVTLPLEREFTTICPTELTYERRTPHNPLARRRSVSSNGWREELRNYLDWERVTPIDEIGRQTWRHWAKRTLRRIKA